MKIIQLIDQDSAISASEIGEKISMSHRGVGKNIAKLNHEGVLERIEPDRGGEWNHLVRIVNSSQKGNID
ncbi:HTH domain-containing protein [Echinicola salinicaeni]|uniref:HTH domain-containing protein n=1 Tax=Echinicola salinicaeni TaxID=2762757 RepID=UPI001644BBBF|nr:HTH domain-containing protein [Echinicola salinicaeni]